MKINEQLAVLTALQKMIKEKLDEIRSIANEELLEAYEDDGVTKKALKIGGVKVGDFIVVLNSSKWRIEDAKAFDDFALCYGFAHVEQYIKPEYMLHAVEIVAENLPEAVGETVKLDPKWEGYIENIAGTPTYLDSGEIVPGIVFTGQTVKNTQIRGCKPEEVAPIIAQMGGIDALLMGGQDKLLSSPKED